MQLISCHGGKLHTLDREDLAFSAPPGKGFTTGLAALDRLPPASRFARAAVHELLFTQAAPLSFALLLARAATADGGQPVLWCDRLRQLYPPAAARAGLSLDRLYVLHPQNLADEVWAVAECLRCPGAGATIASLGHLSRVQARRLQLAAERGGGVGLLLRPWGRISSEYAAATRWLVAPEPGEPSVQRWRIQLVHGHGGRVGQSVVLEMHRHDHEFHTTDYPLRPAAGLAPRLRPAKLA